MQLNLGVILHESASARPDHVAIRLNERDLSYAEVDRQARGIATALLERGIVPGQTVALLIPNVPEFTTAYFGLLYAGFTVVPLNVLLSAPEITYHLQDSGAQLLIAHPFFTESVKAGAEAAGAAAGAGAPPKSERSMTVPHCLHAYVAGGVSPRRKRLWQPGHSMTWDMIRLLATRTRHHRRYGGGMRAV